jgi:hypothetical protein
VLFSLGCQPEFPFLWWDQVREHYLDCRVLDLINRTDYFVYFVSEAIGTSTTPGLLCQPHVIVKMIVEKQMECRLERETEVVGENLSQCCFVHHKPHMSARKGTRAAAMGSRPLTA